MAALEGGIAAVATSSGHAAQFMAISCIAGAGDNIVTSYVWSLFYRMELHLDIVFQFVSLRRSEWLTTSEQVAKAKQWKAHWQFVTLCWSLFLAGWNDGTTGPLLPRIQEVYHVST